jgi:hypothetical protein
MMKKNFTTVRKRTKGVRMIHANLIADHQIDRVAEQVMLGLEDRVSPVLYGTLIMLVRGFDEDMQLEMADDFVDFAKYHVAHTTGVMSADVILDLGYMMIAEEHDILKKSERSRMRNLSMKN